MNQKARSSKAVFAWLEFDYVPGEWEVRARGADVGGKLVVIGSKLNEKAIAELFGC